MKKGNKELLKKWNSVMQSNYGTPSISLSKGKGIEVWDLDGIKYLDFLGGIATNLLGHNHPAIVAAVSKQIRQLSHVSNFYAHPVALELAEKLQKMTADKSNCSSSSRQKNSCRNRGISWKNHGSSFANWTEF